jgi:hypothetical protein
MSTGNIIIRPKPLDLSITMKQVARYAGGSRYRMDERIKKKTALVLKEAENLILPAFVYSVHEISEICNETRAGLFLPDNDIEISKVAACICTLGAKLDMAIGETIQAGDGLHAALLDAAGVALLESLAHLSFSHIRDHAQKYKLFAGCRSGPGYNHVPMEAQNHLFSLVDSTSIGVCLMNSLAMTPPKSLSFFVVLYKNSNVTDTYKCNACNQKDCPYRIHTGIKDDI